MIEYVAYPMEFWQCQEHHEFNQGSFLPDLMEIAENSSWVMYEVEHKALYHNHNLFLASSLNEHVSITA